MAQRERSYFEWWYDNGGRLDGYYPADHAARHMRALDRGAFRRLSPLQAYDLFQGRYGPLIGLEAWRLGGAGGEPEGAESPKAVVGRLAPLYLNPSD